MMTATSELTVTLRKPHDKQRAFIDSQAKRRIIRAGRRGGKTVGIAIPAVTQFLAGHRVLYAAPTEDQIGSFWYEVKRALQEPIDNGIFVKNETMHYIELPGTKQRIRAKTAFNADTLRGDYADELLLDEFQLMNEDAWAVVGAPMLLDNNGNATFIYTPPSLHNRSRTKATDPQHAAKLFKKAQADDSGRWEAFHFTSMDNPYISKEALEDITQDMSSLAYRMEILAEDVDEVPGALWTRENIEKARVHKTPDLSRIVIGVDPSATSGGDEAGIITAARAKDDYYTLGDDSVQGSPQVWATAAVTAYHRVHADLIVAEKNNGGEMVESVIKQVDPSVRVKLVWASRGKATRAAPISALSEQGRDHHVGSFPKLEDELCLWIPGDASPNRLDAKVWAYTELMTLSTGKFNTSSSNYIAGNKTEKRPWTTQD
jgi:phage terminase large subunit-like protein